MFEVGKTYKTKDGREVPLEYEKDGFVYGSLEKDGLLHPFSKETGVCYSSGMNADLTPPEPKKITVPEFWVNVYSDGSRCLYNCRYIADLVETDARIACIHYPAREVEEGEGLK